MSLRGRAAVIQKRGEVQATRTDKSAVQAGADAGVHARKSAASASTASAALMALSRLSACASDPATALTAFARKMNSG